METRGGQTRLPHPRSSGLGPRRDDAAQLRLQKTRGDPESVHNRRPASPWRPGVSRLCFPLCANVRRQDAVSSRDGRTEMGALRAAAAGARAGPQQGQPGRAVRPQTTALHSLPPKATRASNNEQSFDAPRKSFSFVPHFRRRQFTFCKKRTPQKSPFNELCFSRAFF